MSLQNDYFDNDEIILIDNNDNDKKFPKKGEPSNHLRIDQPSWRKHDCMAAMLVLIDLRFCNISCHSGGTNRQPRCHALAIPPWPNITWLVVSAYRHPCFRLTGIDQHPEVHQVPARTSSSQGPDDWILFFSARYQKNIIKISDAVSARLHVSSFWTIKFISTCRHMRKPMAPGVYKGRWSTVCK